MITRLTLILLAGWLNLQAALAADFSVTTPNDQFAYVINGLNNNPAITLVRGKTYTFAISTNPDHPFAIGTAVGFPAPPGVTGAPTSSGTMTFNVPTNAQDCVYYCLIHDFSGPIHMIDPPPTVNIVGLRVGTNLTLTTTQATTNGFSFIPEATTNLAATNWFALTVQSTRFANGTNEIICGRPPGTNACFRIRIQ
jgi:hypothetical protein